MSGFRDVESNRPIISDIDNLRNIENLATSHRLYEDYDDETIECDDLLDIALDNLKDGGGLKSEESEEFFFYEGIPYKMSDYIEEPKNLLKYFKEKSWYSQKSKMNDFVNDVYKKIDIKYKELFDTLKKKHTLTILGKKKTTNYNDFKERFKTNLKTHLYTLVDNFDIKNMNDGTMRLYKIDLPGNKTKYMEKIQEIYDEANLIIENNTLLLECRFWLYFLSSKIFNAKNIITVTENIDEKVSYLIQNISEKDIEFDTISPMIPNIHSEEKEKIEKLFKTNIEFKTLEKGNIDISDVIEKIKKRAQEINKLLNEKIKNFKESQYFELEEEYATEENLKKIKVFYVNEIQRIKKEREKKLKMILYEIYKKINDTFTLAIDRVNKKTTGGTKQRSSYKKKTMRGTRKYRK